MKRTLLLLSFVLAGCATTRTTEPIQLTPLPTTVVPSTVVITTPVTTQPLLTADQIAYLEAVAAQQAQIDVMAAYHPRCAEWLPLLLEVGGRIEDWPIWSRVLWTESRCIDGLEGNGSIGLAQIQWSVHKEWALQMGITRGMMLEARSNLTFAVRLQQASGWSPWRYLNLP